MTLSETLKLFEEKIAASKAELEAAKNGDKLYLETEITFMDKEYNPSREFIPGKSTTLLATLFVRSKENHADEDPEFSYSLAAVLNGESVEESQLEAEYLDFDSRLIDFIKRLQNCTNIEALIAAEYEDMENETKSIAQQARETLSKLKKKGIFMGIAIAALFVLMIIIQAIAK